jgi:hypothetical protein
MRQYLLTLVLGFWLGGLTFYALVVVPIGNDLYGSTEQGFLTQQVTIWLNTIGTATLAVLFLNLVYLRGRLLMITWLVMAAAQVGLVATHAKLDSLLDAATQSVATGFYSAHRQYLILTALQWLAGLVHLWSVQSTSKISPASDT